MATYLVTETVEAGQETVLASVEAPSVRQALEQITPSGTVTIYTVSGRRTARLETETTTRLVVEDGPQVGRPPKAKTTAKKGVSK